MRTYEEYVIDMVLLHGEWAQFIQGSRWYKVATRLRDMGYRFAVHSCRLF